jgi:acyl-CoA synthetase (AMP-forming)/AMP-acid ligase II
MFAAITEIQSEMLKSCGNTFGFYCSKSGSGLDQTLYPTLKGSVYLDMKFRQSSSAPEPESIGSSISYSDSLFYIYTSGTTGLPKAVDITHMRHLYDHSVAGNAVYFKAIHIIFRQLLVTVSLVNTADITPDDVVYNYLPLYHSSGAQLGTAACLVIGSKTVIKSKFSASNFFKDCIKYDVTVSKVFLYS